MGKAGNTGFTRLVRATQYSAQGLHQGRAALVLYRNACRIYAESRGWRNLTREFISDLVPSRFPAAACQ
jgi:hypothetical protein